MNDPKNPHDTDTLDDDLMMDPLETYDDLDADLIDGEILDDDLDMTPPPRKAKKKSSFFTYVVIGLVVIVGGIVLATSFGGSQPTPVTPPPLDAASGQIPGQVPGQMPEQIPGQIPAQAPGMTDPQNAQAGQPPLVAPAPVSDPAAPIPDQGFMNNPNILPQAAAPTPNVADQPIQNPAAPLPAPAPVPTDVPATPSQENVAQGPLAPLPQFPTPAPADPAAVNAIPQAQDVMKAPDAPAAIADAPVAPMSPTPPAPVDPMMGQKLNEAMQRIATLEAELKSAREASTAPSDEVVVLQQKVADLQAQLREKTRDATPSRKEASPEAPKKKRSDTRKTTTRKKESDMDRAWSPPRVTTQWDLRAASDGQAVVTRKGGGAFTQVRVGDTLEGVGRVTAITQKGGLWVIEGTQGRVSQ